MARRQRDYKAEYARRKQLAASKGTTPAKLRRMREQGQYVPIKRLSKRELRRRESAEDKALRREVREWSREHSQKPTTRYRDTMPIWEVKDFQQAFIRAHRRRLTRSERMRRMYQYLVVDTELLTPEEFDDRYSKH